MYDVLQNYEERVDEAATTVEISNEEFGTVKAVPFDALNHTTFGVTFKNSPVLIAGTPGAPSIADMQEQQAWLEEFSELTEEGKDAICNGLVAWPKKEKL